ncbi:MAG: M50 family metallopeptidase [Deltaproteobacteria bacterium]|nr:M50 family metallopeptidase [Deltaproteobacteria bacterium]
MQELPFTLKFRLGPFPVRVEPWFWLFLVALNGNLRGPSLVLWVAVAFVSILVHELGHASVARHFGARASIRLHTFGGLTYPDRVLPRWESIAMTLAGPGAGFLLGLGAYGVAQVARHPNPLVAEALGFLLWVNVFWGVMNLLPVLPLDGGLVLQDALGPRRRQLARTISGVVAVAVALTAGVVFGQVYLAVLFGFCAFQSFRPQNS